MSIERNEFDRIEESTIKQLDHKFYEMATTIESHRVRRGLIYSLMFSKDEWIY